MNGLAGSHFCRPALLVPCGLRTIWSSPANRAPGVLPALARCLRRSGAWGSHQLQKQPDLFPAQGMPSRWQYRFYLYRPLSNTLVPYAADTQGRWPPRHGDNVLAIHASAVDWVARRLCELE
ncbi:hypothetical protein [Synechococcus sp. CB0205]|uniref:hypothetical protein n=1 Tax=Synechococcus sp. CB0205 TaxID=232363 RepID=UPI0002002D7C|nr:hypothetical protein [Synechococcus sp. CB0205]